jgi:hypothetical protein
VTPVRRVGPAKPVPLPGKIAPPVQPKPAPAAPAAPGAAAPQAVPPAAPGAPPARVVIEVAPLAGGPPVQIGAAMVVARPIHNPAYIASVTDWIKKYQDTYRIKRFVEEKPKR